MHAQYGRPACRTEYSRYSATDAMIAACRVLMPPSGVPNPPPLSRHGRAGLLLTLLLALWAYHGVRDCGFVVLDDDVAVEYNPYLRSGLTWKAVKWAFVTTYYDYWHPLPWLTHLADVSLYGLNPGGHHVTNLIFHLANVALVFLFLHALTARLDISVVAGGLFAVHPIHVESVAWVVERKDVLACFFWYACLLTYLRYTRSPGMVWYVATLVLMALGLMCKPMAVTIPAVLLMLDMLVLGRQASGPNTYRTYAALLLEKAPFALLAALSAIATVTVVSAAKGLPSVDALGVGTRLTNAMVSYIVYLRKLFVPVGLAPYYPYDLAQSLWKGVAAGAALAAIGSGAFVVRRRLPHVWWGWLWYQVTLLPVIGLVQTGSQSMADRFSYIPFFGLYLAIASALFAWSSSSTSRQRAAWFAIALVMAVLLGLTQRQVRRWTTSETLFWHTLAVTRNNWFVHGNFGVYLARSGRTEEALFHLRTAVEIMPTHARAWSQLSAVLLRLGQTTEAVRAARSAVALAPENPEMHCALARALHQSGEAAEAVIHYRAALRADPDRWETLNNLGVLISSVGRTEEAAGYLRRAAALAPERFESHYNLGVHCLRSRDFTCACSSFTAALSIRAGDLSALAGRAGALAGLGRVAEACADYALVRSSGADTMVIWRLTGETAEILEMCREVR